MVLLKKRREKTTKDLPTIEEFWEMFTKSEQARMNFEQEIKEAEARWAKEREEREKLHEKEHKETEERFKRLDKIVGKMGNTVGSFAEDFFASKAIVSLEPYGYDFARVFQRVPVYDKNNKTLTDIDLMLSNGEYGMVIEVKTHLEIKDVNFMFSKMEIVKKYPPKEIDGKKLICGVAGINIDDDARERAFVAGFFVFEQDPDMVKLAKPPAAFKAAEW